MLKFLKGFLSAEQVAEIEKAYKEKNKDATGLPEYIPKYRFDELNNSIKQMEDKQKEEIQHIKDEYKDVPKDYKEQIQKYTAQVTEAEEAKKKAEAAVEEVEQIWALHPRSIDTAKAIRALVDKSKPFNEELKRIADANPHFFDNGIKKSKLPSGTGKNGEGAGDDGDGTKNHGIPGEDALRRAMGLLPKNN